MTGRAQQRRASADGEVVAALGPTNTGKTHRAIGRMLQFRSGMLGLPLRLLATEVYDRVTAQVGEQAVALVTGEERRIPKSPAYWICTVEAMPLSRPVDFIAIDEIQLAAHIERGHVFTDRLLHARGRLETWFLGSDTIAPLLRTFIPRARIEHFDRLSTLTCTGRSSLRSLPPRAAVVAFSVGQVYELAERLRRLRGGVAVVLGALSPRTRNAQVAMYQSGEVQYLVATDAIGMGLNLDVNHVAFASVSKFDGRQQRNLYADELAQIAGRAGRHVRDGTFGTLKPLQPLPDGVARAIESHRFPPLRKLVYRNRDLDFSGLTDLQTSLCAGPPHPALLRVQQADDFSVLQHLSQSATIVTLASSDERRRLLWELCQVPNFSKQLPSHHAERLLPLYQQLIDQGRLNGDQFAAQVQRLADITGDIATLTGRLERIRTYCYLSTRHGWLDDAPALQQQTAQVEQQLGDALHARLVERFVAGQRSGRRRPQASTSDRTLAVATDNPFSKLSALSQTLPCQDGAPAFESEAEFVAKLAAATHRDFELDTRGGIAFGGERVGRLTAGKEVTSPGVAIQEPEVWSAGAQQRILRRLRALSVDLVAEASGGLRHELRAWDSGPARGLAYGLAQHLGTLCKRTAEPQLRALSTEDRLRFEPLELTFGRRVLYLAPALTDRALTRRYTLATVYYSRLCDGNEQTPWHSPNPFPDPTTALHFGYWPVASSGVVHVRVLEDLHKRTQNSDLRPLQAAIEQLALPDNLSKPLLRQLGLRLETSPTSTRLLRNNVRKRKKRRQKRTIPSQDRVNRRPGKLSASLDG